MTALAPGIHDVPESVYFGQGATDEPALSASIAKVLLARSPLHAWYAHPDLNPNWQAEHRDAFDLGTAAHLLFLEGEKYAGRVATVDADSWALKIAKEHRAACREDGRIPLLAKDWRRVNEMVEAIRDQIAARDDDPPLFAAGKPEQTLIWTEGGVLCKARLDWLHDDLTVIDDLKSTSVSANPHDYGRRTFWSIGCDVQAQLYRRGVKSITGELPDFRFTVAETSQPFCLSVLDLAPSAIELADQKIDTALELWKRCLETGVWPGYDQRVASVEVGWQAQDFVERFWQDEDVAA